MYLSIIHYVICCVCVSYGQAPTTPASLLPVIPVERRLPINDSDEDGNADVSKDNRLFEGDYELSRLIRRSFLIQKGGRLTFPLGYVILSLAYYSRVGVIIIDVLSI